MDERSHLPSRALAQRAFAQRVSQRLQIRNALDYYRWEAGVRRAQVQNALTDKPHSQWFVHVEMINAKQLDVFFRFGEDAPFDSDSLGSNLVVCREASGPVDEVGDTEREEDSKPLPEIVNDRRMAGEQDVFSFGFFCG